jgi:hypothetical protein
MSPYATVSIADLLFRIQESLYKAALLFTVDIASFKNIP